MITLGTRLLAESLIKNRFPHLCYVRVHTHCKHAATIYAWNGDLILPDADVRSLKQFATDYLNPYVCFKVKAYNMVQTDHVPRVLEVPALIIQTATNRKLNQYEIVAVMNRLFAPGELTFSKYDPTKGIIYFEFQSTHYVDESDKELIAQYLYEITPLGSVCEVIFQYN
ncbi:hypothetical protein D3C73_592410 [compost metagenome]